MKRVLKITAEYIEEWDENDDPEYTEGAKDYTFDDWADTDWDNVGRNLSQLESDGWIIKKKQLKK